MDSHDFSAFYTARTSGAFHIIPPFWGPLWSSQTGDSTGDATGRHRQAVRRHGGGDVLRKSRARDG